VSIAKNLPKLTTTGKSLSTKTLLPLTKIRKGQGFGQSLAKKGTNILQEFAKKKNRLTYPAKTMKQSNRFQVSDK
jgi:hypothetical protein